MDVLLKKLRNDRKIIAGYIISFLVIFTIYLISLDKNRKMRMLSERVDHTYDVITRLERMSSAIKDAENGVRGYVITGERDFLIPYMGSESKADSFHSSLLEKLQDNKVQLQRLARLKRAVDRRFDILDFAISDFENNSRKMTDSMRRLQDETKALMIHIRSTISQMQEDEYNLLTTRKKKFEQSFDILSKISMLALLFSLGLAVFVLVTYIRSMRDRNQGLMRIKDYQLKLTKNIDELNKANSVLIKMRSQEKFAATGRIARTIAHEVRNPLTNINLAAEQLKGELSNATDNSDMLFEMIARNSQRINQLISDLLNSTKFSDLNYEKLSVNDLVNEALKEAKDRMALSNTTVVKKMTDKTCKISVDKEKMKIAILNIIINALEALEPVEGGQLLIETQIENNKCRIYISDNGPGMDGESVSKLFEPYFTTKPRGNGLGLTNSQNIVLNHKGEIVVESEPDKGTKFIIILDIT